jgi:hypothetical protein
MTAPPTTAPSARPASGTTLLNVAAMPGRLGGSRSTTAAVSEERRRPLATPCTIRARRSRATESACQKTSMLSASSAKATETTGRRPTWSDSEPVTSRVSSSATAYTAKIPVRVAGENPISRSRTG